MSMPDTVPLTVPHRATLLAIAAEVGTPVYVYDAAVIRQRVSRLCRRAGAASPRHPLRAQSELDARPGAPAAIAGRAGRCQLGRRDRGGAARRVHPRPDRLHRRGQDRRRAGPRRVAGREGHQRRVARRTRPHRGARRGAVDDGAGRAAREPGHRRQEPPAHLHGAQDEQVRHAARAGAPALSRPRPTAGARAGGAAHPRRLADHVARSAAPGRRAGRDAGPRAARRRHPDRAPGPRRRPGDFLRRHAGADAGRIRGGDSSRRARHRVFDRRRARACARRRRGHAADARDRPQAICRRPALCRAGRRHDRADAPRALRRLPPHRPGVAARRRRAVLRGRRAAVREQRHLRARSAPAAAGGGRRHGDPRCGRVWLGDGEHCTTGGRCCRRCSSTTT